MRCPTLIRVLCAAALLIGAHAAPLHAQTDPLDPAAIEAGIATWLTNLVGPALHLPPHPVTVTRDGDHDHMTMPAGTLSFGLLTADQPILSADIHPVDGIWTIESIRAPSPLHLNLQPPGGGAALATLTLTVADQAAHALIDPTGQTESLMQGSYRGLDSIIDGRAGHQTQHFDTLSSQARLRPGPAGQTNSAGQADLIQMLDATGYSSLRTAPDGGEMHMAAARLHLAFHLDGLDTAKLAPALQSAILVAASIAPSLASPVAPHQQNPDQPAATITQAVAQAVDHVAQRHLLLTLPGLIGGLQIEESADGVSLGSSGATSSLETLALAHAGFGMSANAPDGLLQAKFDVALDGLAIPSLPLAFTGLLPRHIALRPTLSGLNLTALLAQAERTTADGQPTDLATLSQPDLVGPSGLVTSIDRFSLDVGPATLTGNGHVTLRPNQPTQGAGRLSVAGFDALTALIGQSPALRQAVPIFILAKGLARTDGENLVWDISYENGNTAINGTDLTALLPAGK